MLLVQLFILLYHLNPSPGIAACRLRASEALSEPELTLAKKPYLVTQYMEVIEYETRQHKNPIYVTIYGGYFCNPEDLIEYKKRNIKKLYMALLWYLGT